MRDRQAVTVFACAVCALAMVACALGGCRAAERTDDVDAGPPATTSLPPSSTPDPAEETPVQESTSVTLTVVYDNNESLPGAARGLGTGWGFACLIETPAATVLFDTGGDGPTLMANLDRLGIDAGSIDALVLSHDHGDHTGGLDALVSRAAPPVVWLPASFPSSYERRLADMTRVERVTGPAEIAPGVRTLGEMGSAIVEQSLVIEAPEGRVLVTGCAHPGIVEIARRAIADGGLELAIGGFHLKDASSAEAAAVARELADLGLKRAAPTHCTGNAARGEFRDVFGEAYVPIGVGSVLVFE